MKKTLARTQFKKHLGQANHYLVTSLVALYTLDKSNITEAPDELRTAWSPKDKGSSIIRSRNFVLQSFLGWAVDSIDMYLSLLNRKPDYLQNSELSSKLDGAGRSVLKKVQIYSEHYRIQPSTQALMDVLITWRNNVFHELADNRLQPESREILSVNSLFIEENYCGLDIKGLAEKSEKGSILTFKETASLINAAHHFVQEVDTAVLKTFDANKFCEEAVQDAINNKGQDKKFSEKYFSLSQDKKKRFIRNWLINKYSFNDPEDEVLTACLNLTSTKRG
ncbi:hypothetical protein [Aeromonas salmonicida]|uniref:hypothetical protein n=1 Tax=Aeromonas salmonicida TaxID=645 RepID=UPI00259DABA8|nr:hypothetical protein [Aeromonas salmonicida]MDM5112637.1 hypothetical protein [Aeromonas salmonicida]